MTALGVYRSTLPLLRWGAALEHTVTVGFYLVDVQTYAQEADGSTTQRGKVVAFDGWALGVHQYLACTVTAIPSVAEVGPLGTRTGWDDVNGWEDALAFGRQGRPLAWVPNAAVPGTAVACELIEPWDQSPDPDWASRRRLRLVLRSLDPAIRFGGY